MYDTNLSALKAQKEAILRRNDRNVDRDLAYVLELIEDAKHQQKDVKLKEIAQLGIFVPEDFNSPIPITDDNYDKLMAEYEIQRDDGIHIL